jgi:hypothetical protein
MEKFDCRNVSHEWITNQQYGGGGRMFATSTSSPEIDCGISPSSFCSDVGDEMSTGAVAVTAGGMSIIESRDLRNVICDVIGRDDDCTDDSTSTGSGNMIVEFFSAEI